MIAPRSDRCADPFGSPKQLRRPNRRLMWLLALGVLLPSLYGFGTKFFEFVVLFRGDSEGAFAITPIINYLLASFGFLLLFGWAALGGMFRDVERPKHTLLENEAWLDRVAAADRTRPGFEQASPAIAGASAARFLLDPRRRDSHE